MASQLLQLTQAVPNQTEFRLFTNPISSSEGLSITFNFYAYGGTGGDGISFFFVDGSQLPTRPGGIGGSLGYAQFLREQLPGLRGGYLGIGFDAFGNFSSTSIDERVGGPGRISNSIAVRGSEAINYTFLNGTNSLPIQLDNPTPTATRENSRRTANITLSNAGRLTVSLDLNGNGTTNDSGEKVLDFNVIEAGNTALPDLFRFGFAASTGAATNIHEIDNFEVRRLDGTPVEGSFSDILIGGNSNTGGSGSSVPLVGGVGNDTLIIGPAPNVYTGGVGADLFVFSGLNRLSALRASTLRRLSRINDFKFSEGDRFKLDFDDNLTTIERPRGFFNAGRFKRGTNLRRAARLAYADKNFRKKGDQRLRPNEAVFFRVGSRSFVSVNDGRRPFSPTNDLLVEVTGIQLRGGDLRRGVLPVGGYFS
ncbi:hypothetical protein C7B76_24600 [filamentous cyanobacterium CCP2]|nr:hypothetical protein C7B76_24600 [filamentous cyanobacterium CCP2]